jgi:hypothetical protein
MKTSAAMDYAVDTKKKSYCEWLVVEYNVDPFVVVVPEVKEPRRQHPDAAKAPSDAAVSPFHASARKENVAVLNTFWAFGIPALLSVNKNNNKEKRKISWACFAATLKCPFKRWSFW